jgi:protein subunit release factor A
MSRSLALVLVLVPLVAVAGPAGKTKTAAAAGTAPMHDMGGEMTCGQMLEKTSALPAKMAEVMTAASNMFDAHAKWIGSKDKAAKTESETMEKLAKDHREMAERFQKMSAAMLKAKDMPMATHDMKSPMMAQVMESEEKLAKVEHEMAALMTQHANDADAHIAKMRQGSGGN